MTDPTPTGPEGVRPRPSPGALASLILGVVSLVLPILASIPALLVGYRALFAINANEGRLTGRRIAIGGMVLGGLTTVVAVAGFLALIFIDVSQKSRLVECTNNLRRIGLAVIKYQNNDRQEKFPPGTIPNAKLLPEERLSWVPSILPFLDRPADTASSAETTAQGKRWQGIYEQIDRSLGWQAPANQAARDTTLPPFLCPNDPNYDPAVRPAPTTYIGIAGIEPNAALLPKDDPRAGFFGYDRVIGPQDLEAGDPEAGASHTLLVLETAFNNGPWLAGGFPTVRGLPPDPEPIFGRNGPFGGCHRGGMNALFVDGAVQFESDKISDLNILRNLARLHRE